MATKCPLKKVFSKTPCSHLTQKGYSMKTIIQAITIRCFFSIILIAAITQVALSQTEIRDWNELYDVRNDLSGSYILMNNIDASSAGYADFNTGNGWLPIGTNAARFTGTFNGNGFTISGLVIDRAAFASLFGDIQNATISNLGVIDADVKSTAQLVGILAGRIQGNSTITNVHTTGSVTTSGTPSIGGIAGVVIGSSITDSWSSANVTAGATNNVGGLVGANNNSSIIRSFATGNVTSTGDNIGGLVGNFFTNGASITNSYARGEVEGNIRVGGLVGNSSNETSITNTYSTGVVTGNTAVGGLIGSESPDGTVNNSFWDTQISTVSTSPTGTGRTTSEMIQKTSFDGFLFGEDDPWNIVEGFSYPFLRNVGNDISSALKISGVQGWRMMGTPAERTLSQFFEQFWSQGISDANTTFGGPSVLFWNTADGSFAAPSAMSETMNPGVGYIKAIFKDDVFQEEGEFPKWLRMQSPRNLTTVSVPVKAPDLNDNSILDMGEGWNLIANPFAYPIGVTEVLDAAVAIDPNVNLNVYIWNQNKGPLGDYEQLETGSNNTIAPFQAFFVRFGKLGLDETLSLNPATLIKDEAVFYKETATDEAFIEVTVSGDGSSQTWKAVLERDANPRKNAYYLEPLSESDITFYSQSENAMYVREHLDPFSESVLETPLHVNFHSDGDFELTTVANLPENWSFEIIDTFTGQNVSLAHGESYAIMADPEASDDPRFMLRVLANTTDVVGKTDIPQRFSMDQNYPNPFNPSTTIGFQLPEQAEVRLNVYDLLGRPVATLVNEQFAPGSHTVAWDASNVASGVYIYRMEAAGQVITRRMSLIK